MSRCCFCQELSNDNKIVKPDGKEEFVCASCLAEFYEYFNSGEAEKRNLGQDSNQKLQLGFNKSQNLLLAVNSERKIIEHLDNVSVKRLQIAHKARFNNQMSPYPYSSGQFSFNPINYSDIYTIDIELEVNEDNGRRFFI